MRSWLCGLALLLCLCTEGFSQDVWLQGGGFRKQGVHIGGGKILTTVHGDTGHLTLCQYPYRDQRLIYCNPYANRPYATRAATCPPVMGQVWYWNGSNWNLGTCWGHNESYLLISGQVVPGCSGSGVYNLNGELVGIVVRATGPRVLVSRW